MWRLIKHFNDLFLSKISLAVSGFIFWAVASRFYSVEAIGISSSLISAVSFIIFISSLGLTPTFIRFVPEGTNKSRILNTFLSFSTILTLVLCFALLLFVDFIIPELGFLNEGFYPFIFIIFVISMLLYKNLTGALISFKFTRLVLWKDIIQNFLRIILLFVFIYSREVGVFSSNCVAALGSVILVGYIFKKRQHIKFLFSMHFPLLKKLMPFSLVNFLNASSLSLPGMVFPLIIIALFSKTEVGFFYIPWMIFNVYCACIKAVLNVFLMESSYDKDIVGLLKKVVGLVGSFALFGFLLFFFWGDRILSIFSEDFVLYSFGILKLLFASIFFFSINQIYLTLNNITKNINEVGMLSGIILLGIGVFSVWLIPLKGTEGVALAWLFANLFGNIYVFFGYKKNKDKFASI